MPEDVVVPTSAHEPRTDWRLGGRSVRRWREWTLAWALIGLGIGVLAGALIDWAWDAPAAPVVATLVVWIGMIVPIVYAFTRSRPAGLLRFRLIDLLWGVGLALLLRIAVGWVDLWVGGTGALPSYRTVDGALPADWWLAGALGPILVAPLVEEFFFRAVVLVSLFTVLRRPLGHLSAGIIASLVSTALFVLAHSVSGQLTTAEVMSLAALGLTCSALVLLTGRIWPAVILHACYNAIFVSLALVGTFV